MNEYFDIVVLIHPLVISTDALDKQKWRKFGYPRWTRKMVVKWLYLYITDHVLVTEALKD